MDTLTLFRRRTFLCVFVFGILGLLGCGPDAGEGPPTEALCEQYPCDPACADLAFRCSDACVDPADPPTWCIDPNCDALCDPCDADCQACHATCEQRYQGPDLPAPHCDAISMATAEHPHRWELSFEADGADPSWVLSVWNDASEQLVAVRWELPSGRTLDFDTWAGVNAHQQNISPSLVTLLTPMAPQHQELLEAGVHRITVDLEGEGLPCWQWIPQHRVQEGLPYRLRLRIVAVGTSFVDAEQMRSDPLLRKAIIHTQEQFADAGIWVHVQDWVMADEEVRDAYREIATGDQARELLGRLPAGALDDPVDALRVDVALIDRFTTASMLSGLAGGLPGPAALHAQESAGVVISSALLPHHRGEEQVGMILAHELGHYLGLRHTSSWPTFGPDLLDDTPECSKVVYDHNSYDCPDAYNVMFPLLSMRAPHWWSDAQKYVMRQHPAVTQRTPSHIESHESKTSQGLRK